MNNRTIKENLRDSDLSFIGVVTVLIAYLTTKLITVIIKETFILSLEMILIIQLVVYFSIIIFIFEYYYTKKYEGIP